MQKELMFAVACVGVTMILSERGAYADLIGDYQFHPPASLSNEVKGGLPDVKFVGFDRFMASLLTGHEIPKGGDGASADGWALGANVKIPRLGYDGWEPTNCRIPYDPQLNLGTKFTLWMRVLYGGAPDGEGGGYTLLTLDGPDGRPVLNWTTTKDERMAVSLRLQQGKGQEAGEHQLASKPRDLLPRHSKWYDLALSFDAGKVTMCATPLGRGQPGQTQSERFDLPSGTRLLAPKGPLWILRNTETAIERLRIYRGQALSTEQIEKLSQDVRVPGPKITDRIEVGTDRQLFLDDAVIERMDAGVTRQFHSAQKYPGNPVLKNTQGEIEGLGTVFWGSVLYDRQERIFKLWHQSLTRKPPEIMNHLYVYSTDGINWIKPKLGILGPNNRYDIPGYSSGQAGYWHALRKDVKEPDPQKRYKGFIQGDVLWYITSPDGLHWKNEGVAAYRTGDTTTAVYHPHRDEYVKITRIIKPKGSNIALRLVTTSVSKTPLAAGNSPWHLVMLPDNTDLQADPNTQFYGMPSFAYVNVYLGQLVIYHAGPKSGNSEMELVFSRDGLNWHRIAQGTPFIARESVGHWDSGFGIPADGPVEVGDELWFYYSYYDGSHHALGNGGAIGLAKLRRDGFISLAAEKSGGLIVTKPFTLAGDSLEINAQAKGCIQVSLLDTSNKLLEESEWFTGDDCHHIVRWQNATDLALYRGEKIKLAFTLREGHLYAFEIGDRKDLEAAAEARKMDYHPDHDPWQTYVEQNKVNNNNTPND